MKIVDVCAFYSPQGGGVKTYIEQKMLIGPTLGHDITILAPGDDHAVMERGPHARIVTIPSPRFPLDRKYWYFDDERGLHAALDALGPDMVEVSSPWRSPSLVARWPGNAPRSLVMHADPLSAYAYRWLEPILSRAVIDKQCARYWDHLRLLSRQFDRVVCANADLRGRLVAGGVLNTVTQPMGVETAVFTPARRDATLRARLLQHCQLPASAHLLIGVGRLSAEKRWPMVIDAVTAAAGTLPVGLILLGEGSQHARIIRQISGNPHIHLMEPVRDRAHFAAIMASADALVHGCEAETFCMAAAEARACGVPVIVPDSGGAADHARGGAGRTYRATSAAALAQAIRDECASARAGRAPTATARSMTEHFTDLFADYAGLIEARSHKGQAHAA